MLVLKDRRWIWQRSLNKRKSCHIEVPEDGYRIMDLSYREAGSYWVLEKTFNNKSSWTVESIFQTDDGFTFTRCSQMVDSQSFVCCALIWIPLLSWRLGLMAYIVLLQIYKPSSEWHFMVNSVHTHIIISFFFATSLECCKGPKGLYSLSFQ